MIASLRGGLEQQLDVLTAIMLRETRTRYGMHRLGYLWALLEPCVFILTFWAMFELVERRVPYGMGVLPFLVTGLFPYEIAVKTADRVSGSIDANRALLFYPRVRPLDLMLARAALEVLTYCAVFTVLLVAVSILAGGFRVDDLLLVMGGLALAALLGLGLGLVLAGGVMVFRATQKLQGPLLRPLFWVSGLFFTAEELPTPVRDALLWNPLLHCTEMVRAGWFTAYGPEHASPAYVAVWVTGLLGVGLLLERRTRAGVHPASG